jgi:hypothetical protein
MRDSFSALQAGRVFLNGARVSRRVTLVRFGDFVEVVGLEVLKIFGFKHLIKCLPTLRFRLTLKDSIVNTEIFYAMFVRNYSFFAVAERFVPIAFDLENVAAKFLVSSDQYREGAFLSFFLSRAFLMLFRCNALLRFWAFQERVPQLRLSLRGLHKKGALFCFIARRRWTGGLWWHAPVSVPTFRRFRFFSLAKPGSVPFVPRDGRNFGGVTSQERNVANVPDFVQNALGSRYTFVRRRLVLR